MTWKPGDVVWMLLEEDGTIRGFYATQDIAESYRTPNQTLWKREVVQFKDHKPGLVMPKVAVWPQGLRFVVIDAINA